MLAVVCALASSLLYALASVLQHRGAADQPDEESLKIGLLVRLVRHPAWLLGTACDGGGYVLQWIALGHGTIVVVQPLLVCGLLFALPIGAAWAGRRLSRSDWVGAGLVCAGLAAFLLVANPARGHNDTGPVRWIALLLSVSVLVAGLTAFATVVDARRKAVLLAAGAGLLYGAAAALTKTSAHLLGQGIGTLVTHWQPYVLVVFGVTGMLLAQSAFQAGVLDFSLPTMTVMDPVVSIVIGAWVFGETIAGRPAEVLVEVVSLGAMTIGVWLLARSQAGITKAQTPQP